MRIAAIIPARGGSKGIPRKNVVNLCGKPLIAWTIEAARRAKFIGEVIVSSDNREIGEIAEDYGAGWILRGDEASTDEATSESALMEVLSVMDDPPAIVCFLQATSPLRQANDIDDSIAKLLRTGADSVFSARRLEGYTWTACGHHIIPHYMQRQRRQLQDTMRLEENGSIYVFRREVIRNYGNRLGGRIDYHEMHPLDSYQVDTIEDLRTVESLIPMRMQWLESCATSTA